MASPRGSLESYAYLDGQLLKGDQKYGTSKKDGWKFQWDDVLLTMVVFLSACQDMAWGIWRLAYPANFLETINSVVLTSIDDDTTRLTRVGAFGQIEAGLVGFLLVSYRSLRFYTHHEFNGANYQMAFLVNVIGKLGAYILNEQVIGWDTFGETSGMPLDRYFLLLRAATAIFAFLLSLRTYRSSWTWLGDKIE